MPATPDPCFTCLGISMADALLLSLWNNIAQKSMACGGLSLVTFARDLRITFSDLTTLDLDALVSVSQEFNVSGNAGLTSLSLGSLVSVGFSFTGTGCSALTSLNLDSLTTIGFDLSLDSCSVLASFSAPNWLPSDGRTIMFFDDALDVASVDHVLARCVANPAFVSGTVNLSGGTNATPSAAGQADSATLTARGVFVVTN